MAQKNAIAQNNGATYCTGTDNVYSEGCKYEYWRVYE